MVSIRTDAYQDIRRVVDTLMSRWRRPHTAVHRTEVVGCHSGVHAGELHRAHKTSNTRSTDPTATNHHPLTTKATSPTFTPIAAANGFFTHI